MPNTLYTLTTNLTLESALTLDSDIISALQQATLLISSQLQQFADDSAFDDKIQMAFGTAVNTDELQSQWQAGDLTGFPIMEIVAGNHLNGANGAYAIVNNRIYLSYEFLSQNQGNLGAVVALLLEEYGHYVDGVLNSTDAPGDEGAIFASLVLGESLSEEALAYLKAEDDAGVVIINGEIITVEQQVTRTWNAPINGFWDVSSNWTGNQLPVAGDDVIISFPSNNITTTYRTGNNSLNSVLSDEAFVINGGILTVNNLTVNDTFSLSSGTLNLNGTTPSVVNNSFSQSGGTLSGTGEIIVNNNYNWTSGTQSGSGKTTLKGTTNISGTNAKSVDTRTIENQGTVTWTNGDIYLYNGENCNNTATGVFDIQGNNGFIYWSGNQPKLNNAGTLKKTAGTGTTTISTQLNNTGTVQVQTGTLNLTGGGSSSGNWNLSNGATLQLANNYTLQGGVVTGNGTVIGNVANLTQINPGDGVGQLNITGNYNQNSSATLNIELGGNTNYDKLNITGNATLGGTLNISLVNGFAPVLGERYTIFNYGGTLTGGFSNINGLNLGNGLLLQSLIVNKSLVLDVVQDVNYKPGIFSFATTNFSVNENGTPVNAITINRTGGTDGIVSVTLTPTAGTATAGTDYNSSPITITFNPGEASKTVNIPIIDDNIHEGNETLNLTALLFLVGEIVSIIKSGK
ncbi:MAG: Calx-beta domain-containing protein [Microcystis sp.]